MEAHIFGFENFEVRRLLSEFSSVQIKIPVYPKLSGPYHMDHMMPGTYGID